MTAEAAAAFADPTSGDQPDSTATSPTRAGRPSTAPEASRTEPAAPPFPPRRPPMMPRGNLSRVRRGGITVAEKGGRARGQALGSNRILKELDLSRCSIGDKGGAALFASLEEGCLVILNLSWNGLRGESAKALSKTLSSNGSLQSIDLGHNGLSDQDAATIIMGLTHHGGWMETS